MKKILIISALLLSSFSVQAGERLAVVELFTSQGCSSCPPADSFLGELSKRSDVLALAYHVDYWDYIGWDDVHAKAAYSDRQRLYANTFNLRYVYTPQMIVNGNYETSGNQKGRILKAVQEELARNSEVSIIQKGHQVEIDGLKQLSPVDVVQVSFHKEVSTKVKRGENRGRTLTDYHIVTRLGKLGEWQGGPAVFHLFVMDKEQGHGLFLQRRQDLKILGAVRLNH